MLDHILQCVQGYESEHGISPDVVYINPFHYEGLIRNHPKLFSSGNNVPLGFRLIIVPSSNLLHPRAASLTRCHNLSHVA